MNCRREHLFARPTGGADDKFPLPDEAAGVVPPRGTLTHCFHLLSALVQLENRFASLRFTVIAATMSCRRPYEFVPARVAPRR